MTEPQNEPLSPDEVSVLGKTKTFRAAALLLLKEFGLPTLLGGEAVIITQWEDKGLATSYELLSKAAANQEGAQEPIIQLAILEIFPDGQESCRVYATVSDRETYATYYIAMTREEQILMDKRIETVEPDENGLRYLLDWTPTSPIEQMYTLELLTDIVEQQLTDRREH